MKLVEELGIDLSKVEPIDISIFTKKFECPEKYVIRVDGIDK